MKKINVYYVLSLVLILGCSKGKVSLVPTYNEGGYEFSEFNITSEAHQDSVYISGKIFSAYRSNNLSAMIQLGCYKANTGDGHYNIKTAPFDGEYPLTATSIGS